MLAISYGIVGGADGKTGAEVGGAIGEVAGATPLVLALGVVFVALGVVEVVPVELPGIAVGSDVDPAGGVAGTKGGRLYSKTFGLTFNTTLKFTP